MIYLILSIVFSVVTVSFFKLFEKYNVQTFPAIVFNYIACVVIGNSISENPIVTTPFYEQNWFPYTVILGILFISIFLCIGLTAQKIGVSVSMISAKLSVVIPVTVALFLHNESLDVVKIGGIILSLVAVYFISKKGATQTLKSYQLLLPAAVFIGSGLIDTLLNYTERRFIPPASAGDIVTTVFLLAALLGISYLMFQWFTAKRSLGVKEILWGLALGIPNYFSMYFLVLTLQHAGEASQVFPINNIGIALMSTLASVVFFKEKMNSLNWIGVALAVVAIALLSFV